MTTLDARARPDHLDEPPALAGIDHLELWVGNARQSAVFFGAVLGFDVVAHAGAETGWPDRSSYVLQQGSIRVVVTGALAPRSPIAEHVRAHGDGVHDVAFTVWDATAAFHAACHRGARPVSPPALREDDRGAVIRASVAAYGDTIHSFVERQHYRGVFAPGFQPAGLPRPGGPPVGLEQIDHVVANVDEGSLEHWVGWYRDVLGLDELTHFGEDQIATGYSALRSTVVWNRDGVVLPINEPAPGLRTSQIQEYLDYYRAPGVQHLALRTGDIVATVEALRARGLRFLDVPPTYYDEARERLGGVDLPWDALAELGILVDRDESGHLLQVFTEGITDRPTLFLEIIERRGATGFGEGNFKALFEAIEREQERRGNL
ncbi:MAG TPA: 4-hydroxyphenylpyruvate dioxygenase [Acidimicrobiia bacterium]